MIRLVHRWPGLVAGLLLLVLSLSGALLSIFPAVERLSSVQADALSTAELAERIQAVHPGVEQIRRRSSGRISAYWSENGVPRAAVMDPASGREIASTDPNPFERWLTRLHRSLLFGDAGRMAMAAGAAAMLVLTVSGAVLVARCRRLAALVLAVARAVRGAPACRARAHRCRRPALVFRHGLVDDGLDLRPPA